MDRIVTAAAIQFNITLGEVERNLAKAEAALRRVAASGAQGATERTPRTRASSRVETVMSPCISTISGAFPSSSRTRVLTTACSSRPSSRADTAVPPFSS